MFLSGSLPDSGSHGPIPCPSPRPVPACGRVPILSHLPELGWVPIRQADITESHSQTWKQPKQWGSLPLGTKAGLVSVGTRQLAHIKSPGWLVHT